MSQVLPHSKRQRNELIAVKSAIQRDHGVLFLQNQVQVRKLQARLQGEPIQRQQAVSDETTPVWLPKQALIQRNMAHEMQKQANSKSQAIEKAEDALTKYQVAEESFDYKDFNFIVSKQRNMQQQQQKSSQNVIRLFQAAKQEEQHSRSSSPQNERYAASRPLASETYLLMKQYELKKRLSSEVNSTARTNTDDPLQAALGRTPGSIKICLEDLKPVRTTSTEAQNAYVPLRMSQQKLKQQSESNAYLSLSSKKKNTQYWHVPQSNGTKASDEIRPLYHVTIQIDPNLRSPSNTNCPAATDPQKSPYQLKNQIFAPSGQQRTMQEQSGSFNLKSTQVGENNQNSAEMSLQQPGFRSFSGPTSNQQTQAVRLTNNSPRTIDKRQQMVFSPEPKLLELVGDETRLRTLPAVIYPVIPKRTSRQKGSLSGLALCEDKNSFEQYLIQNNNQRIAAGERALFQSGGHPFKIDEEASEDIKTEQVHTLAAANNGARRQKITYICPYASAKIAKLKESKEVKGKEQKVPVAPKKPACGEGVTGGEASVAEEQKTDLRTAEQKAEDLKNYQKELLRKFVSRFPPKKMPNIFAELEEERQRFLQARKDANRKYTEISANNNKPGKYAPLKFVIQEGNNSNIIRRVMQSRLACNMPQNDGFQVTTPTYKNGTVSSTTDTTGDERNVQGIIFPVVSQSDPKIAQNFTSWQESNTPHLFNFRWKPTSYGINFERLGKFGYKQLVNHIEGHQALTTKDLLFYNMKAYCEQKKLDVYSMIPLTFAVDFLDPNHQPKFDQILQTLSLFEKNITLSPEELSSKLQVAQAKFDKILRSPISVGPSEHQGKNLWLLKPTGFNRGIGIHVFNSLDDLQNILWTHYRISVFVPAHYRAPQPVVEGDQQAREAREKEIQKLSSQIAQDELKDGTDQDQSKGSRSMPEIKNTSFIVQKYIEAPLLFRKRKFDIRIWALISHDMKLYLFKEAYVRTSSEEYDLSGEKLDQVYVHLTNNAVQKYSKNYGKFEDGNIVSVAVLSEELASQEQFQSSMQAKQIERSIYQQMKEQIIHSYEAIRSKLRFTNHSFELVGYDFMVVPNLNSEGDSSSCTFKTRLIEANTNPCLEESNELLRKMLPRMVDDMLKIVLDPLFGTTLAPNEHSATETETGLPVVLQYPIEGYQNNENMFELIANPPMP